MLTTDEYIDLIQTRIANAKAGGDAAKLTAQDYRDTKGLIQGLGQMSAHGRLRVKLERKEQAVKDKKLLLDAIAAWELAGKPGLSVRRGVGGGVVGLSEVKV